MTAGTAPAVRTMGFPGRYLQGPGALSLLPGLLDELGARRPVLVADAVVRSALGATLDTLLHGHAALRWLDFPGECSRAAIAALAEEAGPCDTVVALGGGKTIDTAKGVARQAGARLIVVPTIASNDSPTSRLIVLYDEQHRVAGVDQMVRNPDVVLVDTAVIARAPARFFAAGIGDALSKTFEAGQCHLAGGHNLFGTPSLPTARLLADRCHATIVAFGEAALQQVATAQVPDDAVERVVEATVLLSGIGFESGGLSLAHAVVRGFSAHPVLGGFLHGEVVAFGTLVQLAAEGRDEAEIAAHAELTRRLALPACFDDFGIAEPGAEALDEIARITATAPYIHHLQRPLDAAGIRQALETAHRIGRASRPGAPP